MWNVRVDTKIAEQKGVWSNLNVGGHQCRRARACSHHVGPGCAPQLPILRVELKLPTWQRLLIKHLRNLFLSFSGLLSQLTLMYLLHTLG